MDRIGVSRRGALARAGLGATAAASAGFLLGPQAAQAANDSVPAPTGNPSTDTPNIQNAINAAGSAGKLVLAAGTYVVDKTITITSGVQLCGSGKGATTVQMEAGGNVDLLQTAGFAANTGNNVSGPRGFAIRDLTLDQNGANQTAGWVARLFGNAYTVNNVAFINGHDGGVWSECGDSAGPAFWRDFEINGYYLRGPSPSGYGLYWGGPHDSIVSGGFIDTLNVPVTTASSPTVYGLYVAGPNVNSQAGGRGTQFSDLHVWGNHHYAIYPAATHVSFSNMVAEGATLANLVLLSLVSWMGGQIYSAFQNAASITSCGIQVGIPGSTGCGGSLITGVWVENFSQTASQPAAISFVNDWGVNTIQAIVAGGAYNLYSGSPSGNAVNYFVQGWSKPNNAPITLRIPST